MKEIVIFAAGAEPENADALSANSLTRELPNSGAWSYSSTCDTWHLDGGAASALGSELVVRPKENKPSMLLDGSLASGELRVNPPCCVEPAILEIPIDLGQDTAIGSVKFFGMQSN